VRYQQQRSGIPVFSSDLRVLVRNEEGFPVVLAASSLHDLGSFVVDAGRAGSPFSRLEEIAPDMTSYSEPQVVIWAGVDDVAPEPVLAITFTADNYDNPDAEAERWLYIADAGTGAVLHRENLICFAAITGYVQGNATQGYKADICGPEEPTTMPYALLKVEGDETDYYTKADGAFPDDLAASGPVTVTSYMEGRYFKIFNWAEGDPPPSEGTALSATLTPGADPYTFVHNEGDDGSPDYELTRSQVNCYVAANKVRDWVLWQNPDFPVICTGRQFDPPAHRDNDHAADRDRLPDLG
jgi:hypothetical protein